MKHKHWTVVAFDRYTEDGQETSGYVSPVEIEILNAPTEKDAIRQASKMIIRKIFVVRKMRECFTCSYYKYNQLIEE